MRLKNKTLLISKRKVRFLKKIVIFAENKPCKTYLKWDRNYKANT